MGIIILILIFMVVVWLGGFVYANDFSVPTLSKEKIKSLKKVLIIFPHADDEALTSGGFISNLASDGVKVDWIVLTQGEKGNPNGLLDENLKKIRTTEAQNAANIYGVNKLIVSEYPDGGVDEHRKKLKDELHAVIRHSNPEMIITYDLAGLYGHPDHVVTSEVVTGIIMENFPNIRIWYASYPQRILDFVTLPERMAKDANFKKRRVYPTTKVWVGGKGVINKVKAVYAYESQRNSYLSSFPIKFIPLWFYISLTPFEYYHEVK